MPSTLWSFEIESVFDLFTVTGEIFRYSKKSWEYGCKPRDSCDEQDVKDKLCDGLTASTSEVHDCLTESNSNWCYGINFNTMTRSWETCIEKDPSGNKAYISHLFL